MDSSGSLFVCFILVCVSDLLAPHLRTKEWTEVKQVVPDSRRRDLRVESMIRHSRWNDTLEVISLKERRTCSLIRLAANGR